ncbi:MULTISPECIES: SCP2 sterol-binding domain-containing protein [Paenibacillus]|uniref:SCP2 sterol-binding domain-containing protein n=1 Tax=Paenibacillus TaxID=44249 RepID=UPI0022B92866|nr:SCP2 sterol-binding domain-containing protein [Paenibacillus caseinilyticus]MCZ8518980.1 SCP2 sterol-binding domain-containing protein [Paenibacillus caseinilyticus]
MVIREEIEKLVDRMNGSPEPIRNLQAVYQFDFGGENTLQVRFKGGQAELVDGTPYPPDCKLILTEDTMRRLMSRRLNAAAAYMEGKLKMEGKLTVAFRLQEVLKSYG